MRYLTVRGGFSSNPSAESHHGTGTCFFVGVFLSCAGKSSSKWTAPLNTVFDQKPCPQDFHRISRLWVENQNLSEEKQKTCLRKKGVTVGLVLVCKGSASQASQAHVGPPAKQTQYSILDVGSPEPSYPTNIVLHTAQLRVLHADIRPPTQLRVLHADIRSPALLPSFAYSTLTFALQFTAPNNSAAITVATATREA